MAVGEWHAQGQCTGARHNEHSGDHGPHQCRILAPPIECGTCGDQQHCDGEAACHLVDQLRHRRSVLHRSLFGPQSFQTAIGERAQHLQFDRRTALSSASLHRIAHFLPCRQRFPSDETVIDMSRAIAQHGIHRNKLLIAHHDTIAGYEVGHLHRHFSICCSTQDHQWKEILQGTIEAQRAVGVCLVPTTDQQEEEEAGERIEIAGTMIGSHLP